MVESGRGLDGGIFQPAERVNSAACLKTISNFMEKSFRSVPPFRRPMWWFGQRKCFPVTKLESCAKKDYRKEQSQTRRTKEPTMKEVFHHAVLYYKIYFLKLNEGMDACLSEVDCRSVTAATVALVNNFDQNVIQKTRTVLFQYAKEMLRPVEELTLRDKPRHSFARDVAELYWFVARHTTCFPWMVLSAGSRQHYLQQQLKKTNTTIKQGNPTEADGDDDDANFEFAKDTDNGIFQQFERVMKVAVSTLWLIHK